LEIAKKCGADVTINPSKCDVVEEVKKLSEGYGCDVYIEATGHPSSVVQG
jgi:threonine dehydrogenase-like Zn-dependent dehydrogenase